MALSWWELSRRKVGCRALGRYAAETWRAVPVGAGLQKLVRWREGC